MKPNSRTRHHRAEAKARRRRRRLASGKRSTGSKPKPNDNWVGWGGISGRPFAGIVGTTRGRRPGKLRKKARS